MVRAAEPNLTTPYRELGFVPDSNKKKWTIPEISTFADTEEVWDRYKNRGTPEERAKLRALLDAVARLRDRTEVRLRRAS